MKEKAADIAIVGAGAAGLMTAVWAGRTAQTKRKALRILLFDTRRKVGAKILMSGGTRCNVTNRGVKPSDFQGGARHFIKHILEAFTPQETLRFFKEIGVELVSEPTGKYFPSTHSAQTVLDALLKEVKRLGIILVTGIRITKIEKAGEFFHLTGDGGPGTGGQSHTTGLWSQWIARKVILTTGGRSYPTTGSDGTGYEIAKSLGHTLIPTFPALTPLLTKDNDWKELSGVSLEVEISFFKYAKKQWECLDSFLFTHFGFSGPAALDISRHFAAAKTEEEPEIFAGFLPGENESSLKAKLAAVQKKNPKKQMQNLLAEEFSLPGRFVETLLKKKGGRGLVPALLNCPLKITGVFGYKKAEVTAGGVDLGEVNVSTMESKLVEGLYFAGEILDADGRIGGFNFQWAWSTGTLAGRSAARGLLP